MYTSISLALYIYIYIYTYTYTHKLCNNPPDPGSKPLNVYGRPCCATTLRDHASRNTGRVIVISKALRQ